MVNSGKNDRLTFLALSLLFGLIQFRMIMLFFQGSYYDSVNAAVGVLTGHPHWVVYQNRVLGPWIIAQMNLIFPNYAMSYDIFSIIMITIVGYLASILGREVAGSPGMLMALLTFQMSFVMLLSPPWLYVWDYLSTMFFFIFIIIIQKGWSYRWIILLFAVAIFNREDALFIALWLIIDPFARWLWLRLREGRSAGLRWWQIASGVLCLIGGWFVIAGLRKALLVEEIGPKLWPNIEGYGTSYHLKILKNILDIEGMFSIFSFSMPFLIPIFLVLMIIAASWLACQNQGRWLGLALVYLGLVGATMTFSDLMETRVYLVFIPLLVLTVCQVGQRSRPAL